MNKTLKLTCISMLTAISIVANFCTIQLTPNNAISFTIAVCFVTGIYFGALPAAIVGYCGDLIAHFIPPNNAYAYNWFMALSCTLYGVICALVYKLPIRKLAKLIISLLICFVVCLCSLNTFGLWLQFVVGKEPGMIGLIQFVNMDKGGIAKSFWVYLAGRLPFTSINLAVNGIVVGVLQQTKTLDKLFTSIIAKTSKNKK